MKKFISALILSLSLCSTIFSAETKIAKDAKIAIKKYVGYEELQKRGFKLNQLDNIQTVQDFYEVLLPFMIQNGKPLDNLISLNEMNFARHKNIVFENIYGKKEELIKKGYSEEKIFYYPAAGKDFYRVGKFEWGKLPELPNIWNDIHFYKRPFLSKDTAYFWVPVTTEKMFEPYYKELESKKNIILDFRMYSGGWGNQVHNLGTYLEGKKYKGKIFLITDRTSKNDFILSQETKTGAWNNGVQERGNLNWIVIGENSFGVQKYITNADWNYRTDDFYFSPLPLKTNDYAVCEEGVGVFPDVWAVGDEDILKTLEFLTGDKEIRNLVKNPFDWRNKLIGKKDFFYNENWQIPKQISNCKSDGEYNVQITDWLKTKLLWKEFVSNHEDLKTMGGWGFELPACFNSIKDAKEYNDAFARWIKIRIDWAELLSKNSEAIKSTGDWGFELPECFNSIKGAKEYNDVFARWIKIRTDWVELLSKNSEVLKSTGGWWFEQPECFNSIKNAKEYNDAFARWIKIRTDWAELLSKNSEAIKSTGGWGFELPACFNSIKNAKEYNDAFTRWIEIRTDWAELLSKNSEVLKSTGGWGFELPACFNSIKDAKEYNDAFARWIKIRIDWAELLSQNSENLKTMGGWGSELPACFNSIKDAKEYNDAFARWIKIRTDWAELLSKNSEAIKSTGGWWLEPPEAMTKISNHQNYLRTFETYINLESWWTTFLITHQPALHINSLKIYKNDLDELFPERNNPDKYFAQLDSYLKDQSLWIDYLMPQPLVIPSSESYKKAEKYKGLSQKIGKNCSSVPGKIRNIQKSNPEEYVNQMVAYINSVAENDFEKIQMVFSIEQEILRYDSNESKTRVERINIAKNGVGEDYETYLKNLNKLWEDSGEEPKKQDWKSVVEEGTCVCDGYSQLMQWFCYKLGIKNRRIFTPHDMVFAEGHSWNIVQIEGEDYPLDATWGLSYLYMKPDKFYTKWHFPREPEEQLLEKPYTLEEYKAVYK